MAAVGVKTVTYAAMAMVLALICAASLASANGNVSDTANSTEPAKTDSSEGGMSLQLKICLVIAGVVTVIGLILCLYIRTKAENSYAMGGNVPKPLGGMPDDY